MRNIQKNKETENEYWYFDRVKLLSEEEHQNKDDKAENCFYYKDCIGLVGIPIISPRIFEDEDYNEACLVSPGLFKEIFTGLPFYYDRDNRELEIHSETIKPLYPLYAAAPNSTAHGISHIRIKDIIDQENILRIYINKIKDNNSSCDEPTFENFKQYFTRYYDYSATLLGYNSAKDFIDKFDLEKYREDARRKEELRKRTSAEEIGRIIKKNRKLF